VYTSIEKDKENGGKADQRYELVSIKAITNLSGTFQPGKLKWLLEVYRMFWRGGQELMLYQLFHYKILAVRPQAARFKACKRTWLFMQRAWAAKTPSCSLPACKQPMSAQRQNVQII